MALGQGAGWQGALALLALLGAADGATAAPAERQGLAPGEDAEPGTSGSTPLREYRDAAGRLCRVYARTIVIAGEPRVALATVCREANGRWVLSR